MNASQSDFAITRYTSTGSLDTTFASAGTFCVDFAGGIDEATSAAFDGAGNIVIVGLTTGAPPTGDATPEGTFDATFNPTGATPGQIKTALGTNDFAMAVHLNAATGAVTVAGAVSVGGTETSASEYSSGPAAVARFTSTGALDLTFNGTGSFISSQLMLFAGYEHFILDESCAGQTILGGFVGTTAGCVQGVQDCQTIALLRLTSEGTLDPTFSTHNDAGPGVASFPITNANALTTAVVVDSQQDVLLLAGDHLGNPFLDRLLH